jgi:hypothetical protein
LMGNWRLGPCCPGDSPINKWIWLWKERGYGEGGGIFVRNGKRKREE